MSAVATELESEVSNSVANADANISLWGGGGTQYLVLYSLSRPESTNKHVGGVFGEL